MHRRRLLLAGLLVAAACGGRTPLDLSGDETEPDAGTPVDGGIEARDAEMDSPRDASRDAAPSDASSRDGAARDAAADVGDDEDAAPPPVIVSCTDPTGLQPGSPWPIARRCPSRGGHTAAVGPASDLLGFFIAPPNNAPYFDGDIVVAADGTLYVHDFDGHLDALAPDGTLRWSTPIPQGQLVDDPSGFAPPTSLAIGADGTVYAYNGDLTAVRPDGTLAWSAVVTPYASVIYPPTDGDVPSRVALRLNVGPDGTIYVADAPPAGGGSLFAFGPTGETVWQASLGAGLLAESSPSIGAGGSIYVPVMDTSGNRSLEVYTQAGGLAWSAGTGTEAPQQGGWNWEGDVPPTIGPDGTAYVSCGDDVSGASSVCAYSVDGSLLRTLATDGPPVSINVSLGGDPLYVSTAGSLQAFSQSGTKLWSGPGEVAIGRTAPVVDGVGKVFASVGDGLAAMTATGTVLWFHASWTPIAMGADGTVYTLNVGAGGVGADEGLASFQP